MSVEADYFLAEPEVPVNPKDPLPEAPPPYEPAPALHRKADRIHDLLPRILNSRQDPNWTTLIGAIGAEDDRLTSLIEEVRDQFFVKTASRPYLDRLAGNHNLSRPRLIGLEDNDFRKYIPVLSYQPKQVKQIIDTLLDLFFLKETTTAFITSTKYEPFTLTDGWDLLIKVEGNLEQIKFSSADFYDIASITLEELIAAYNRQAKYSYATAYFNSATNTNHLRIFTNTVGAEGSLEIEGGLANIGLELNGFLSDAGTGDDTRWSVSKIGDSVTFLYTGGTSPGLDKIEVGDIFICDIPGNQGSFVVTDVDAANNLFRFSNLFAATGNVVQTASAKGRFLRPEKISAFHSSHRALAWQTRPGQIIVEMPTTPSVVKRALKGGFHINGVIGEVTQINSTSSLTVNDATTFPTSGKFTLEPVKAITARLSGDTEEVVTYTANSRNISNSEQYSYTSITGNTLFGITPSLPDLAGLHEFELDSLTRTNHVVLARTVNNHDFVTGDRVAIRGSSGIPVFTTTSRITLNSPILGPITDITNLAPGQVINGTGIPLGTRVVRIEDQGGYVVVMSNIATATNAGVSVTFSENIDGAYDIVSETPTSFSFNLLGADGTATSSGTASVERIGLAAEGSRIIVSSSTSAADTKIIGPYLWDNQAPFTLSSHLASIEDEIVGGKSIKLLTISNNSIPNETGHVIFDYGKDNQEGPVKYLYKPTDNILALDPAYIFKQKHNIGSSVIAINHKGPHILSGTGTEYAPYITNPATAREILQDLIRSVTSAGFFIDFLVRNPTQLYGVLSAN